MAVVAEGTSDTTRRAGSVVSRPSECAGRQPTHSVVAHRPMPSSHAARPLTSELHHRATQYRATRRRESFHRLVRAIEEVADTQAERDRPAVAADRGVVGAHLDGRVRRQNGADGVPIVYVFARAHVVQAEPHPKAVAIAIAHADVAGMRWA